jgi:hypothetical protein
MATWGLAELVGRLEKLLVPGVIGLYHSFEVTEIVGYQKDRPPTNFLSLLVAEPGEPPAMSSGAESFINGCPIRLRGSGWKFGILRHRISCQHVVRVLHQFRDTEEWRLNDKPLSVGGLTAVPPQYVPADSNQPHPWNGVLKNNFWGGSHILELFDTEKNDVRFLYEKPELLIQLASHVRPYVPLGIDGLSDRLGNILIQLPVTALITQLRGSPEGDLLLNAVWHSKVLARPLRVYSEIYEDTTFDGFSSKPVGNELVRLPLHSQRGGAKYVIWDDVNEVILGATSQIAFMTAVSIGFEIVGEGLPPREFRVPDVNGGFKRVSVPLKNAVRSSLIGKSYPNLREPWRSKRLFRDGLYKIQQRKEFVQYGGPSTSGSDDALADIHCLLANHGITGAWLWDPYLDAVDVLNTLFYCPHPGAELRALTSGKEPACPRRASESPDGGAFVPVSPEICAATQNSQQDDIEIAITPTESQGATSSWKSRQAVVLNEAIGSCEGLKLEFRIRDGGAGWSFHDRFLIFPTESGGALAWSLGTSINSLGKSHHILQKVADGELIKQAFLELWDKLAAPDYLVWKTP